MPVASRYLLCVSMDVDPEYEDLFNEVYDTEHVPNLMRVDGVHSVTRARSEPFAFAMGGEVRQIDAAVPRYVAMYEVDDPSIVSSDAWATAVEQGRWPGQVRPHTSNRSHAFYRVLGS